MKLTVSEQADAWMEYSRFANPNEIPDDIQERGWNLYECAFEGPAFALEAIKEIVSRYSEEALFTARATEAKDILANLGAGPLESLLEHHGKTVINEIEAEAKSDRRFFWTLACVWKSSIPVELWARVQRATSGFSP